jgi:hypothetical protein
MKLLQQNEQIRIQSVKQLEQVYEVLKEEWDKDYTVYEEIDTFNCRELMKYVYWYNDKVALFEKNHSYETITFGQFMYRVNSEPKTETIIIESTDGKKYEVIMIREVKEPLTFNEWYDKSYDSKKEEYLKFSVLNNTDQNSYIEKYIQYRKSLES